MGVAERWLSVVALDQRPEGRAIRDGSTNPLPVITVRSPSELVADAHPPLNQSSVPQPAPWRIQVGAYKSREAAVAALKHVRDTPATRGLPGVSYEDNGTWVRLRIGPYYSLGTAKTDCAML